MFEAGHPHELLSKYFGTSVSGTSSSNMLRDMGDGSKEPPPRESLAGMVHETGALMTTFLRKMALAAFQTRSTQKGFESLLEAGGA